MDGHQQSTCSYRREKTEQEQERQKAERKVGEESIKRNRYQAIRKWSLGYAFGLGSINRDNPSGGIKMLVPNL